MGDPLCFRVDRDQLFNVLNEIDPVQTKKLKEGLKGIPVEVVFCNDNEEGNGSVLLQLKNSKKAFGKTLRFNEDGTVVSEATNKNVVQVASPFMRYLIGGIFGNSELKVKQKGVEKLAAESVRQRVAEKIEKESQDEAEYSLYQKECEPYIRHGEDGKVFLGEGAYFEFLRADTLPEALQFKPFPTNSFNIKANYSPGYWVCCPWSWVGH